MRKQFFFLLFFLFVSKTYSKGIDLVTPINNFSSPTFNVIFSWNPITSQTSYRLKIAQDSAFNMIINDITVSQTNAQITFSSSVSAVYWKIVTTGSNGYAESNVYKLNFINPTQDGNLLLWLAADSNLALNPDSTISAWNNIIPNGLNAVQGLNGAQPKLVNNLTAINNSRAVRFDGLNDFFQVNSGGLVGSAHVVCNWRGNSPFPNYNGVLTKQAIAVFDDYIIMGNSGTTNLFNQTYFNNNVRINNIVTLNFSPLSSYKIISGRRDNSIINIPNFNIGKESGFAAFWNGDIAEIIISKNNTESEADSIQTYLHNKYAPPITMKDTVVGNSFCTPVTINAPDNYTNYLWSTGETTASVSITPNNIYSVKGKDVFGKETTTIFKVFPYVRLNNATITICQGDTFKLDLKTPVGFTALWNTGAATTKIDITNSGTYIVRIRDAGGICFVDDTINVIVDNPQLSPMPDGLGNLRICQNEKLFLNAATSFDSIRWSTGSTANFISVSTPGNYSVFGRNLAGCIINQSFNITIAGQAPTANFSFTPACQRAAMNFLDASSAPVGANISSWKWNFSNNTNATIQNPVVTFDTTGTFSAALKVTTNQGCSDSIFKTFVVNKKPVASFSGRRSCEGNPTLFQDESTPNAASITNWSWNFAGLGVINGIQNPSFVFPSANAYNVKLTVTNTNGCTDSTTRSIVVSRSPISDFSFDSVCGQAPVNFKFLANIPLSPVPPQPTIAYWSWDFGDGMIDDSRRDISHAYSMPGIYDVKLFVRSSDGCTDTAEKQVRVFDFPIADFNVSNTQCTGKEIYFTDNSQAPDGTPIVSWNWYFAGQSTANTQNASYTFNEEGNYIIQLTVENAIGCSATKLHSIAVSEPLTPQFTFSPQGGLPPLVVNYTNQSPANGNYIWDYGDNSPLVAGYNPPAHTYTVIGFYPIQLIATNFRGCTDTLTKYILVDRAYIDGIITSIIIIPVGDYYQIQATILNSSNVEIRNLGLNLQLGNGSVIRENWTGSLLPGQTTIYNFLGQIKLGDNAIPVVCATIDNINNNSPEDRTDNNTTCKEVTIGSFDVLNVYPSPAYETINFGIMLPKDGKVFIGFVDVLGQVMYKKDFDGIRGYNNLSMSTISLNATAYVAVITFDGETIYTKFMRTDR